MSSIDYHVHSSANVIWNKLKCIKLRIPQKYLITDQKIQTSLLDRTKRLF